MRPTSARYRCTSAFSALADSGAVDALPTPSPATAGCDAREPVSISVPPCWFQQIRYRLPWPDQSAEESEAHVRDWASVVVEDRLGGGGWTGRRRQAGPQCGRGARPSAGGRG